MVWRVQMVLVAVKPLLPPETGLHIASPWLLGQGMWLPVMTLGSRDPLVLPGVYPFLG